jgi:phosphoribosyl-ATP pyrophosphohydrolase/phosphoribosyl-AMP cyclohydrolase
MTLQNLKFDERGLIPTIVQERLQGTILMFSYMNQEALALTLQTGVAHFWNPVRRCVLQQTNIAGQTQRVVDLVVDSEGDALIIKVDHPASRSGEPSPVGPHLIDRNAGDNEVSIVSLRSMEIGIMLSDLFQLIRELERERPEHSYTARLFDNGLDFILKKLNEQATETIIAAKNNANQKLSNHMAELLYHLLVVMVERRLDLRDVLTALRQRAGPPNQPVPQESRSL